MEYEMPKNYFIIDYPGASNKGYLISYLNDAKVDASAAAEATLEALSTLRTLSGTEEFEFVPLAYENGHITDMLVLPVKL